MYVYACICMYENVFPGMAPRDAGTDATSPKQSLSGPAPLSAFQSIRSFTFFRYWQHFCRLDLAHIPPPARVQSP